MPWPRSIATGEVHVIVSDPWDAEALGERSHLRTRFRSRAEAIHWRIRTRHRSRSPARRSCRPAFTSAEHVSATYLVEELRRIKSADELDRIRQAAELSDRGYQHFAQAAEVGMTEYELVAEVEAFLKSNGAEDNFMLIASGGTEVVGMKPPTERKLQIGRFRHHGTHSAGRRLLGADLPDSRYRRTERRSSAKHLRSLRKPSRPPRICSSPASNIADVARVQNDVFRKYGYGDYTGPKYTRVRGHNLGLHPDENPYVLEDVNYIVKEGMVVIAHPNTYLPLVRIHGLRRHAAGHRRWLRVSEHHGKEVVPEMKRGWITWDKTELPPSAFESRLAVVRKHLAARICPRWLSTPMSGNPIRAAIFRTSCPTGIARCW